MRSPALAIAWEFGRRLRPGLAALLAYAIGVGTFMVLRVGPSSGRDASEEMGAFAIVPVVATFFYLLAVFSFGLESDVTARESMYPARMFSLPASTRALAGWPMLFGLAATMALWFTTTSFVRWMTGNGLGPLILEPWGFDAPAVWPALLAAVFLAWIQALTWMPWGLRGLRVVVSVLGLVALEVAVSLAIHYEVSEAVMTGFLAPLIPIAYLGACAALARARRGDVPDWLGTFAHLGAAVGGGGRARDPFPSATRAQAWFEWRLHGWSLPTLVAMVLPFEVGLLFLVRGEGPALTFYALIGALLTPPLLAGFVAATLARSSLSGQDLYGMPAFTATRPLSNTALIAAKLKVTIWSTLMTWLLVLAALASGLALSGTLPVVVKGLDDGIVVFGRPRMAALVAFGALALLAATWKRLVHSLVLDLSGREWLVRLSGLLTSSFLIVIWPLGRWLHADGNALAALLDALPLILAGLVGVKLTAAGFVATRLFDLRLVGDRALVTGVASWCVFVFALYGILAWFWNTPHVARYFLLLIAILEMPLARLAAAPLALAWNRHR